MSNSDEMFNAPAPHSTIRVLRFDETNKEPASVPPDRGKKFDMVFDSANLVVALLENVENAVVLDSK